MASPQKLWSATVTAAPQLADAIAEALEEDSLALTILAPPRSNSARIEALYGAIPDRSALTARLAVVAALHQAKPPKIEIREAPKLDWLKKVAGDFPPLPVARWIIFGAQHSAAVLRPRRALQIDATSAFGTGEHPTTRGCLIMLDWAMKSPLPRSGRGRGPSRSDGRVRARQPHPFASGALAPAMREKVMLDLGCGTGILAMGWAKAARRKAVAVDLDPESVRIAKDNIRVNGLQNEIRAGLSRGYHSPLVRRHAPYDLIMANIFAGPLCRMAKDLKHHLKPGGVAILSGILNTQANKVLAAHRMQGLRLVRRIVIGEWSILALKSLQRAE